MGLLTRICGSSVIKMFVPKLGLLMYKKISANLQLFPEIQCPSKENVPVSDYTFSEEKSIQIDGRN